MEMPSESRSLQAYITCKAHQGHMRVLRIYGEGSIFYPSGACPDAMRKYDEAMGTGCSCTKCAPGACTWR